MLNYYSLVQFVTSVPSSTPENVPLKNTIEFFPLYKQWFQAKEPTCVCIMSHLVVLNHQVLC